MIEIRSLSKTFRGKNTEVHALRDINLKIEEGDIFGIIGMSGAGKSTLVRCMNMLEVPTEGTVFFNGMDLSKLNRKQLREARRSMGMIFQQFNLLMQRTAEANICFPLEISGVDKITARKRAKELLELVGLADKAKAYPSQLSGGQKQRIAIARALATDPKLLLLDEPAAGMNPNETAELMETARSVRDQFGIAILLIEHDMNFVMGICEEITVLDYGRVIARGDGKAIRNNPKVIAAYLGGD